MTPEQIRLAADAAGKAADDLGAQNAAWIALLKETPGFEETLRRELAKLNLDPATVERVIRADLRPEDAALLAGLKITNS